MRLGKRCYTTKASGLVTYWYSDGRVFGYVWENGEERWYDRKGNLHKKDGPALVNPYYREQIFYLHGIKIGNEHDFNEELAFRARAAQYRAEQQYVVATNIEVVK